MSVGPAMPANLRGLGLARVHRFDLFGVVLLDDLPLNVQLQRELTRALREVLRQQREVLDRFPVAQVGVDLIAGLLNVRLQAGFVESLLAGTVAVGNDERGDVRPSLSD